jgi:hypothetical protein
MATPTRAYFHPKKGLTQVKQGFSWPAFFFGSLWAAVRRMWFPSFVVMALLDVALWFLTGYAEAQRAGGLVLLGLVATLAYAYLRGRYGNRLLEASLLSRGYTVRSSVRTDS